MDKKILLGGAAALLLVGNMIATPANAALEMGIAGEATVGFTMGDVCDNTNAAAEDVNDVLGFADGTATTGAAYTDVATVTLQAAAAGVAQTGPRRWPTTARAGKRGRRGSSSWRRLRWTSGTRSRTSRRSRPLLL